MSLVHEQAAFLKDLRRLLDFVDERGLLVTGGELERKPEMQQIYVSSGYSKTMDSMHLRKCAIDLNFFRDQNGRLEWIQDLDSLKPIGAYWETLDPRNRWGGNWTSLVDTPHFERNLGPWPARESTAAESQPANLAQATRERPGVVVSADAPDFVTLRRGSSNRAAITRLQDLLKPHGYEGRVDGVFGATTEAAVVAFQKSKGLVADGVVGEKTWTTLLASTQPEQKKIADRWLGDGDLDEQANALDLEQAAMRAVYKVESNGAGFVGDRCKILFEGHVFWERLKLRGLSPQTLAKGNDDILYPKWTRQFYVGGGGEWKRLERACAIHEDAALESASWGLFQIMGYHWKTLSYESIHEFVDCMGKHERDQLDAFCRYISVVRDRKDRTLVELLRQHEWAAFAYAYNGSGYRQNAYDDKLREAYLRYSNP